MPDDERDDRERLAELERRVARLENALGMSDPDPLRDGTLVWREAMKVKNQATGRP